MSRPIIKYEKPVHGKTSKVFHKSKGVFKNLPNPFIATRYHSLVVDQDNLPNDLEVTAWLEDGTIMGLSHQKSNNLQGVQFHPESVLTQSGHQLLSNFLNIAQLSQPHC